MNNDNIGLDPSLIETIESLDEPSNKSENNKPKKEKKGNNILKKVLFTLLILAIMFGVAYGLYYYLNLGSKHAIKKNIVLKNMTIYEGQNLSNNISEYGVFDGIDVTKCLLDTKNVNTYIAGEYVYKITCDDLEKEAKVIVKKVINIKTKLIEKVKNDEIDASELIETSEENNIHIDLEEVKAVTEKSNELSEINILVNDQNYKSYVITYDSIPYKKLECTSKDGLITDKIVFDNNNMLKEPIIRITKNVYNNDEEFINAIPNDEKKYIIDTANRSIDLIEVINKNDIGKLDNYSYLEIYKYYKSEAKDYICQR